MFRVLGKRGRGLLFVVAALALAAACSGSSGTAAPTGSAANAATNETAATSPSSSGGSGSGLTDAAARLSNATSYKFKMILSGGDFGQTVGLLGAAGVAGDGPFTLSGTVVAKPAKAADVQLTGFHVVEVDGYDYIDTGLGGFVRTPMTDAGWTDSVSPVTMFSSPIITSLADSYQKVGSETKNGVNTDHYQAVSAAFAEQASILGVTGATWSGDVWIATDGGYPVSVAIIAKASNNSVAYQMSFDLTNINDPANSVIPPTNLVGA